MKKVIFNLLLLLFAMAVKAEKIYIKYDPTCMDRYLYSLTNSKAKNAAYTAYLIKMNDTERVVFEIGEENVAPLPSIEGVTIKCGQLALSEALIRRVNKGETQVYIVKDSPGGFLILPVIASTYFYKNGAMIGVSTDDAVFSYDTSVGDTKNNLADKNTTAQIFVTEKMPYNCKNAFIFKKTNATDSNLFSEYTFVPELGIVQQRVGQNAQDASSNFMVLESINGIPLNVYTDAVCTHKDLTLLYQQYVTKTTAYYELPVTEIVQMGVDGSVSKVENVTTGATTTTSSTGYTSAPTTSYILSSEDLMPAEAHTDLTVVKRTSTQAAAPKKIIIKKETPKVAVTSKKVIKVAPVEDVVETEEVAPKIVVIKQPTVIKKQEVATELVTERRSTYVIQQGETLYSIARKYGLTLEQLRDWNSLDINQSIAAGTTLHLVAPIAPTTKVRRPVAEVLVARGATDTKTTNTVSSAWKTNTTSIHVVKAGETLTSIAGMYGFTVARFKEMNGLKDNNITIGQQLKTTDCVCKATDAKAAKVSYSIEAGSKMTTIAKPRNGEVLVARGGKDESKGVETATTTVTPKSQPVSDKRRRIHIVKDDETISTVAKKYNMSVSTLKKLNNLDDKDVLLPFQKLVVE